jgi:hypothetical protein
VNDFSKWNYWQDIALPVLDQYKKTGNFSRQKSFGSIDQF